MRQFLNAGPGRVRYTFTCRNVIMMGRQNWINTKQPRSTGVLSPEHISFHFQIKGQQTIWIGEQQFRVRGGEVFVIFPGETVSIAQEKGIFYWLQMLVPREDIFLDRETCSDEPLKEALLHLQPRQFRGSALLEQLLDEIHTECQDEPTPLFAGWILAQITKLMFEVVKCAHRTATVPRSLQPIVHYINEQVAAHGEESLAVPALAERAGLSVPGFERKFKKEMGLTPAEYVVRVTMDEAKRQLALGRSVTTVAMELNFCSSQYFAAVFRQHTGQTPSAFQKEQRAGKTPR